MAEETSQSSLWQLLDQMRSMLPVHEMGVALAALLYLRWADFQEAELEAIAAFDDTAYEPVLPPSLHWRTWHQLPPQEISRVLAERLPAAVHQFSNCRHNPLATHLHRLAGSMDKLAELPAQSLKAIVEWLAAQPFETPTDRRQLLNVFDRSLLFSIKGQEGGIRPHLTPQSIALFIALLADPKAGNRIYDPCFGSAGLLTAACDAVLNNEKEKSARTGAAELAVSGVEINSAAYIVGLTRLALAGIDDPQLELGNSLERTQPNNPQQEGFDVVVANPPFGMRANAEVIDYFPVQTKDATGLFIQHALAQLRPGGRAVIVVPQGILFRGGPEKKLRQFLLEQHTVETVISLPVTTFLPFSSVKSNILILRRGGTTRQIRMVDAEQFFAQGKGRQPATISEAGARELVEKIREPKPSECCWDIDAATLAETEFDLTPRRRDQSGLDVILGTIQSEVPLVQLKECCQIMPGRSVRSADLVDEQSDVSSLPAGQQTLFDEMREKSRQQNLFSVVEPIPFIRIKDINKGQATRGNFRISAEAALGVKGSWKLRAGDVLLSKSGTIGKVGIVRNGAVGAVAGSGMYVLRADNNRLDPHFLTAYLDSSECRSWLKDRASGAVISHLTKRIIEEIPVPLPPLQIQQRVAVEWREHGVEVLAYLAELLTDGGKDPIAVWVEKELKDLPAEVETISDPLDLSLLERLAAHARPLRNEAAHGRHGESALVPWLLAFNEAVSSLRGVSTMPHGPSLLSVLQESTQGIKLAREAIKGHLPNEAKARTLTQLIEQWLAAGSAAMLNNAQLIFSADTATLRTGEMAELFLKVKNRSPLPLREIEMNTSPDWGRGEISYLAENGEAAFGLQGMAPKSAGPFTIVVRWSARTLDGRTVEGKLDVAFDVLPGEEKEKVDLVDLGGSPYVCGDPIRPERNDVFFGREELLEQIRRQIVQSGNVVLLEGNRRAGKSSILRHLEGVGPVPGWLGVYCSLQAPDGGKETGVPTANVFREIAYGIAKGMVSLGISVPLPDGSILPPKKRIGISVACRRGISEEAPFADFRDYAEVALETTAEHNLGILLMLDEFDKLQEGIDNGVTSPQVPENIRYLVQTYPQFSAILTGAQRFKRLRKAYWSVLYGLGTPFNVTSLSPEAATKLVREPVKGLLTYSKEAVEKVINLCNGQPFLLQCLCNRIFDMAAQLKIRSVTMDLVEQAGDQLVQINSHFDDLWNYAGSDRRRFILSLIHKEADREWPLPFGTLQEMLSMSGVEVRDEDLIADLEFLRDLELVEWDGQKGNGYVLSIPLMGRWIDRQHDFAVLQKKARMETEDYNG